MHCLVLSRIRGKFLGIGELRIWWMPALSLPWLLIWPTLIGASFFLHKNPGRPSLSITIGVDHSLNICHFYQVLILIFFRYYSSTDVLEQDIRHVKLKVGGGGQVHITYNTQTYINYFHIKNHKKVCKINPVSRSCRARMLWKIFSPKLTSLWKPGRGGRFWVFTALMVLTGLTFVFMYIVKVCYRIASSGLATWSAATLWTGWISTNNSAFADAHILGVNFLIY